MRGNLVMERKKRGLEFNENLISTDNKKRGEKNRLEGQKRDNAILGVINSKEIYNTITNIVNISHADRLEEPIEMKGSANVKKREIRMSQKLKDDIEEHVKPLWEQMMGQSKTKLDKDALEALRKFNVYVEDSAFKRVPESIRKDLQYAQDLMQTTLEPSYWDHIHIPKEGIS